MIAIMALYQRLVKVQAPLLPAHIRQEAAELPSPAHWALALADIAATDSYPVNRDPSITQELRFAFIAHLLDFIDQEVRLRHPHLLARKYLAYARLAIEDDLENVPEDLTLDSAVARALSCFPLTRTQALKVAEVASRNSDCRRVPGSGTDLGERSQRVTGRSIAGEGYEPGPVSVHAFWSTTSPTLPTRCCWARAGYGARIPHQCA
ncbi:hypothetical protein ACIP98_37015 [Streptomyces sp. NPDC088354]|uniref:hypothetical protein n=1 Tax=Streptomyces sp. NPDC088354 TaxID=3365856 RepID=UPI0038295F1F